MAKIAHLYISFDDASQWLMYGDVAIAGGKVALTGVEATVIRAEDFKNNVGAPNHMPVVAYGGHNAGNPAQSGYYWDFPSAGFGNMYMGKMEIVVPVAYPLPWAQQLYIYARDQATSWTRKDIYHAAADIHYCLRNNIKVLYTAYDYRKTVTDEWQVWDWLVLNKYFYDDRFKSIQNQGAYWHNCYDPLVVNPATPKGRLFTLTWTQGSTYLRSSGNPDTNFEDTGNPGIIDLWPGVMGYCLPKNAENLYWEVTADFRAAYDAGTAELFMNVSAQNRTRHLFSGTLSGLRVEAPPVVLILGTNDVAFSLDDGVLFGCIITFPDRPDIYPRRVFGGDAVGNIYVIEDVPVDVAVAGQRYDVWIPAECPITAFWPINEGAPDVLPLPYSDDLTTLNNFDGSAFAVGDKFVFGIYMNNYVNFQVVTECSELTLIENPAEDISVTVRPTFVSFTKNGTVGTAIVSDINPTDTVYAYAFALIDIPQTLFVVGSRIGNGEINLTLPDKPVCVFLVNYSDNGYSKPSTIVYPSILGKFDGVAPTITNVVENTDSVEVTISGTSEVLSIVYYTWEGNISWHYGGEVLGSGVVTISGLLPNKIYHFIALSKLSIE